VSLFLTDLLAGTSVICYICRQIQSFLNEQYKLVAPKSSLDLGQPAVSPRTTNTFLIMQIPSYGAAPLSATFLLVRAMQVVAMITVIGITANFINSMVSVNLEPPQEIVGTIAVVSCGLYMF